MSRCHGVTASGCHGVTASRCQGVRGRIKLTLRLLILYIYGAPSKARNANVVYMYGPTFGNAQTVSFYLLHNVSTLNQC